MAKNKVKPAPVAPVKEAVIVKDEPTKADESPIVAPPVTDPEDQPPEIKDDETPVSGYVCVFAIKENGGKFESGTPYTGENSAYLLKKGAIKKV